METGSRPHVVVVGGGIAGLAAAWFLRRDGGDRIRTSVLVSSSHVGGKLRVSDVAGVPVDEGAESLLARRPEATDLARAVGLGDDLLTPATTSASVWTRGALRPMPSGTVMGVPGDLRALAASGVLTPVELARVPIDHWLPRTPCDGDVSVGGFVAARLGHGVVDRLVEPLLGGVYAGHASELSLEATVPALYAVARGERSLLAGARRQVSEVANSGAGPVFAGLRGGVGRLAEAVATSSGADIRVSTTARDLRRTPTGWQLIVGSTREPETLEADAVVLAVPARPASRILAAVVPVAAMELAGIDAASVAILTLAYPRRAFPRLPAGSGFLVPPVERRLVKAATFSTAKWAWYADLDPGLVVVRLSVGRYGEEHDLQHDDDELVLAAADDLAAATGVTGRPVDARVTRWGGSLPQYTVGHLARVARIRAAVEAQPGLAVCGATYDGVGIAACIASAGRAATTTLSHLVRRQP
jgi:oxygen-dependent protoporphyrinogen oxidase